MKRASFFTMMSALLISGAMMTGCNKDSVSIPNDQLQTVQDDALLDAADEDINSYADQFESAGDQLTTKSGTVMLSDTCPIVTHYRNGDTVIVTVDFGTSCTDLNGNVRSGKIVITKIGKMKDEGYFRSVSLENFKINGNTVQGTRIVRNMGLNQNNNYHFSVSLQDGKFITEDGDTLERSYERDREWVAGYDTPTPWDNEFMVTGSASGVNFNGEHYTRTIMEPLVIKMACRFIVSGIVETDVEGKSPITLDYGNGDCDALATLTVAGETKAIDLKMRRHRWVKKIANR